jgi:nicotinamidase-related amidase
MSDLDLNAVTTAVVLIDLQRGIVSRTTAPHSAAEVVKKGAGLAERFRRAGAQIVLVHVDLANAVRPVADVPFGDPSAPPPPASASELVEELGRQADDWIFTKRSYDAFVGTNLEQQLRGRKIRTIVLGGISTNAGVESTARTAAALGFEVVIVEDATASTMGEAAHHFAFTNIFPRIARVRIAGQLHVR